MVAAALDIAIAEERWPEFVQAATLDSMRDRALDAAPDAHLALWLDPRSFLRSGGRRDWASFLAPDDLAHFDERLVELAGDATPWILSGRAGLRS